MIRSFALPLFCFLTAVHAAAQTVADSPTQSSPVPASPVQSWLDQNLSGLVETYQTLHRNPELSHQEAETAKLVAARFRAAGLEVTTGVGGHGVVGILTNGDGPTLMLRCDLDALPVTEQTALPYASAKRVPTSSGGQTGVMHACGHDVHMTNVIGVTDFLAGHTDLWSGTLMVIGQPAEEMGEGAKAMLEDGLFERFPKPDFAIAMHVSADDAAGTLGLRAGYIQANVDSVDITMIGRGGHGSSPHKTIDPITQAAQLVMSLQTIVSREVDPRAPAVVTVGSIHGGTKHNIIGDQCHLQLTVRTYDEDVRKGVLEAIERKSKAVAIGADAPEPQVVISQGTPSLRNDDDLIARLRTVFRETLGPERVFQCDPSMGGEDFSRYGRAGVPIAMLRLGSVAQSRLDRFAALDIPPPSLHSALYYPEIQTTLRTSIPAMTAAAIDLLQAGADSEE